MEALRVLSDDPEKASTVVVNAYDASSTPKFEAIKNLLFFHGGDTGNFDQCEWMTPGFHHCLAGSTDREGLDLQISPFAGICVPVQCEPEILQSGHLLAELSEWSMFLQGNSTATAHLSPSEQQQVRGYMAMLLDIFETAKFLEVGFTCGEHVFPPTRAYFITVVGLSVLVLISVTATLINAASMYARTLARRNQFGQDIWGSEDVEKEHGDGEPGDDRATLVQALSIVRNAKKLFKVHVDIEKRGPFACLDGIRALSLLWVISGHCLATWSTIGFTNPIMVLPPYGVTASVVGQLFFSARFAVDSFLLLSGFLLVINVVKRCREFELRKGRMPSLWEWMPALFGLRVIRILPMYTATLMFFWHVAPRLASGPFWFAWEGMIEKCDQYWWTNFLFIQNVHPFNASETDGCFLVSWYLALDMQLTVLAVPFLGFYLGMCNGNKAGTKTATTTAAKSSALPKLMVALTIVASTAAAYWYSIVTGVSALSFDGDKVAVYSQYFYTKPWFRAPPYFIGIFGAMMWLDKDRRRSTSMAVCGECWKRAEPLIMVLLLLASGYIAVGWGLSGYQQRPCQFNEWNHECGSNWSVSSRAAYNAMAPVLWSLCVGGVCRGCFSGRGGLVGWFLTHPGWAPLARLSYGAYLIHPIVILSMVLTGTEKIRFDQNSFLSYYIASCVVTFAAAMTVSLVIESPINVLTRRIIGKDTARASDTEDTRAMGPMASTTNLSSNSLKHLNMGQVTLSPKLQVQQQAAPSSVPPSTGRRARASLGEKEPLVMEQRAINI